MEGVIKRGLLFLTGHMVFLSTSLGYDSVSKEQRYVKFCIMSHFPNSTEAMENIRGPQF